MEEQGLKIENKTLYGPTERLYLRLSLIQDLIKKEILDSGYVHIDETTGKLLQSKTNGYIRAITNSKGAYFQYETTRSGKVAREILYGYEGEIISDGFSGYNQFNHVDSKINQANCWSHVRRKFFDCHDRYPEATEFLELVSKLYRIEHEAHSFDQLKGLRDTKSRKVIDEIKSWLEYHERKSVQRTSFNKAIWYTKKLWKGLTLFLEDPLIPLDNNAAERVLRNPVKGRDNYNGYRTINGADVAMFFYTIIESCKKLGINPRKYFRDVVSRENMITPYQYAIALRK